MQSAWVHNISPFLIEFGQGIGIRWYGLAYLAGFVSAYLSVDYLAKKGRVLISREQVADFITYAAIGTLAGGRLGYALFYAPDLFTTFHSSFPFWGLLEVHKGGMASHGGIAGVVGASILYARKYKLTPAHMVDLTCFGGSIGFFFGRIANFINGELYGRECPPNLWMAVKFPGEVYTWGRDQLERIKGLGPAVQALGEVSTPNGEKISANIDLWNSWVANYDSSFSHQNINFFMEALVKATEKHNQAVLAAIAPALTPRYPSQLIQAVLEGLLVFLILVWAWRKPRPAGYIACAFGFFYTVARIIGEQFRMPDQGIGFQLWGLTRGQWLSVGMMVIILGYFLLVVRKREEKLGGWRG